MTAGAKSCKIFCRRDKFCNLAAGLAVLLSYDFFRTDDQPWGLPPMHARGLFLRGVRIPSSALPCLIALIINLPGVHVQTARGQDRPAAAAAVEARLRERMAGYWSAMERSDYETAAGFVHPESREVFNHEVPKSRVIKWKIGELRFSPDLTWCD